MRHDSPLHLATKTPLVRPTMAALHGPHRSLGSIPNKSLQSGLLVNPALVAMSSSASTPPLDERSTGTGLSRSRTIRKREDAVAERRVVTPPHPRYDEDDESDRPASPPKPVPPPHSRSRIVSHERDLPPPPAWRNSGSAHSQAHSQSGWGHASGAAAATGWGGGGGGGWGDTGAAGGQNTDGWGPPGPSNSSWVEPEGLGRPGYIPPPAGGPPQHHQRHHDDEDEDDVYTDDGGSFISDHGSVLSSPRNNLQHAGSQVHFGFTDPDNDIHQLPPGAGVIMPQKSWEKKSAKGV